MDAFAALRTLLAVRSYQAKLVPDAVVRRILEAGRLTGSGMNRQPWHFIVVRAPATLKSLGALASSGPISPRRRWPSSSRPINHASPCRTAAGPSSR
jgi:nitroreductase